MISQLLISNVTTEINGSTIYCSEDGDETNSPMTAINIPSKDKTWPFHAILIMLFHNIIYYIIGVGTMGALGAGAPPMLSDSYIARLNFIHADHTALAYRAPLYQTIFLHP